MPPNQNFILFFPLLMVKINPSTLSKTNTNFWTEKNIKNFVKNQDKNSIKSRTIEWLQIPYSTQKKFAKKIINVDVDYLQYTCYDIEQVFRYMYGMLGFNWEIDDDNSNIEYNERYNLSLHCVGTKMWRAYTVTFLSPWFPPIPIISLEIYNEDKVKLLKTQGKIVFYGSYFPFRQIIAEDVPEVIRFANWIERFTIQNSNSKPICKRTRVDIALDFEENISMSWIKRYITPHKNSKHAVRHYNWDREKRSYQSLAYIPSLSRGIGIRIYNKILDLKMKNKKFLYPEYGEKFKNVMRIEMIYAWDFAQNDLFDLIKYTKHRILWDFEVAIQKRSQPKSEYSPLSAYNYFKRYAKNHGKTLIEVLDDVTAICITEERKDLEMKSGKYQEIEIFESGSNSFSSKK